VDNTLLWFFGGLAIIVAVMIDPRESARNKRIYWLLPPSVAFAGYLVFTLSLTGALVCSVAVLVFMALAWLRSYRPGPGLLNQRSTPVDKDE